LGTSKELLKGFGVRGSSRVLSFDEKTCPSEARMATGTHPIASVAETG